MNDIELWRWIKDEVKQATNNGKYPLDIADVEAIVKKREEMIKSPPVLKIKKMEPEPKLNPTYFKITEDHIKLIREMCFSYNDNCEFGAPEVNPKRPYGNSDVFYDINEILGNRYKYDEDDGFLSIDEEKMLKLHKETTIALQIFAVTGELKAGKYMKTDKYRSKSWVEIK